MPKRTNEVLPFQIAEEISAFVSNEMVPKSLGEGSGRFLWRTHECWQRRVPKRNATCHSLEHLIEWIQQNKLEIPSIPSLQHKLKGRIPISAIEARVLLTVFLLYWDSDGEKNRTFEGLSRKEVLSKAKLLTACIVGDRKELTIAPDVQFKGKRGSVEYYLDWANADFRWETILTHIANKEELTLPITDKNQILRGKAKIIPLAIQQRTTDDDKAELAIHAVLPPLSENSAEVFIFVQKM